MAKEVTKANPVAFDATEFDKVKTDAAIIAKAKEIGAIPSDAMVWSSLVSLAVHCGTLDKESKRNEYRPFADAFMAFAKPYGEAPGRKPYSATSLQTMASAMNNFVRAGYIGKVDAVGFALRNFKGSFTQRGAKLGKLLDHLADKDGTIEECQKWLDSAAVKTAGLSAAINRILSAAEKVEKDAELKVTMQEQKSARIKWLKILQDLRALKASVVDEPTGDTLSADDEIAALRAQMGQTSAPPPAE